MKTICAKDFFLKFKEVAKEDYLSKKDSRKLLEIYKNDEKKYTEIINKEILANIMEYFGLVSQFEYFRIDVIGWLSHYEDMKEESKKVHLRPHLWDLYIAAEHENSKRDWTDEVFKLAHIKCPLKVIISYSHCDEVNTIEKEKLHFVSKWIKEINAFSKGEDEEYLIILGNCFNKKTKADYDTFDYRGYVLNRERMEFEPIQI